MEEELDPKNLHVIRQKLASLKKAPGQGHFEYYVGKFKINIWVDAIQEHTSPDDDNILLHATVNVDLHEVARDRTDRLYNWVYLSQDVRFKDYEPIKYNVIHGRYTLPASGDKMPILQLCELIKYLYRLSNLTAFM